MKNKVAICIIFALTIFSYISCKKIITLDLVNGSNKLVIEGNIDNVAGPQYVRLSRNVPFTNTNTYPAVSGANVFLTDNLGHQYQLNESLPGTYSINPIQGITGTTYNLKVVTDGQTYTSSSTVPKVVTLDSISAKPDYFNPANGEKVISVHFKDPSGEANQYRFVMYVNSVQVKAIFAYDDQFIDGKYVNLDLQQNDTKIHAKDTVSVEMQCIDKPVYKYWFTLSQQQVTNPGGQVAPANPPSNITPATLGYFSAHTTQTVTLIVK